MSEIIIPAKQPVGFSQPYVIRHLAYSQGALPDGATGSFGFTCPVGWQAGGFVTPIWINAYDWITTYNRCNLLPEYFFTGPGSYVMSGLDAYVSCSGQNNITCTYPVYFKSNHLGDKNGYCMWYTTGAGTIIFLEVGYCINPNNVPAQDCPN